MASTQTEMTTKKSSGKGRKNSVGEFYVNKIDLDVMKKYVKDNNLEGVHAEIDEETTPEQLAMMLSMHVLTNVEKKSQVKCENCNGVSSKTDESCPYCGDDGEVEEETKAKGATSDEEEDDEEDSEEESSTDDDDEEEEEEKPKAKKKAVKEEKEEEDDEDEEETEDSDDEEEEDDEEEDDEEEKVAAKGKGEKVTTQEQTNGTTKKKKVDALAKSESNKLAAKDLDKSVAKVLELKSDAAENYWAMGKELLEINARQLWKLRLTEEGKSVYRGFDAFVVHELKMTPQHAYSAIDVAKNYETSDEVRELGHTKAALILKAAPEDREKLKAKAKKGATAKELKKDVKESRETKGAPKADSPKAKAGDKGSKAKAKINEARSEKISIAAIEGSKTIKLFKKPESMKGIDWTDLERAKKVSEKPFGKYELAGGVTQYFSVIMKEDEGLVLKIETRRETPAEE